LQTEPATTPNPLRSRGSIDPASATAGGEYARRTSLTDALAPEAPSGPPSAPASGNQFIRSSDKLAPQLVRFADVPQDVKHPQGPYRQAPPEFGGEWWFVNPFTGPEPWLALERAKNPPVAELETEPVPAGFLQVFGARPKLSDVHSHSQLHTATVQWEQDMSYFKQIGVPEGFDQSQVDAATVEFEAWGMGKPVFYEGRYGWQVRFPDSQLPSFEAGAAGALLVPHLVIAQFQARSIEQGVTVARYHPMLPGRLQPA
jgi:hypothetical protein